MFQQFAYPLSPLQRPEWLAILPLALLPLAVEALRPVARAAVPAGWGMDRPAGRRFCFDRWLVPTLLAAGLFFAVLGLAGPIRPVFAAFQPPLRGHFWSVVLDCSGSMSIVDPGRQASRLRVLADDLAVAVQARYQDRFAIVRVAGYADRVGPASANSRFLIDSLHQIMPALPGEDGTNLGDALVLAAASLPADSKPLARSILIVSDGRENPPDDSAFRLERIVPALMQQSIRVDWLRLDLPAASDESPASRARGEASRQLLEKLVNHSGGAVIDSGSASGRSAIFETAMARFQPASDEPTAWPTASTACLILAFAIWTLAAALGISAPFRQFRHSCHSKFRTAAHVAAMAFLAAAAISALGASTTSPLAFRSVSSRWMIVMDASPSMSVVDTANGSRLASAVRLARGLIDRLSFESGATAAVLRFSGRVIPQSGWTQDWSGLSEIIEETDAYSIRPTGSDWDAALRAVANSADIRDSADRFDTHIVFLTDGEPSQQPGEDVVKELIRRKWKLHFVTFGDDAPPGASFLKSPGSNQPWIDRRTGKSARSARNDFLAKQLAAGTDGKFLAVGQSDFEAWEMASAIIGPVSAANLRNPDRTPGWPRLPSFITALAVLIFLIGECVAVVAVWNRRFHAASAFRMILALLSTLALSCSKPNETVDFESVTEMAWSAWAGGDETRARSILTAAASLDPHEPAYDYNIALIDAIRNQPQAAMKSLYEAQRKLDRLKRAGPEARLRMKARILAARGYTRLQSGGPRESVDIYGRAIATGSLTEPELADARKNAAFAEALAKDGRKNAESAGDDSTSKRRPEAADPMSPGVVTEANLWNRMAEEARGRALTARSRFEPAGDETGPGVRATPGQTATIDW